MYHVLNTRITFTQHVIIVENIRSIQNIVLVKNNIACITKILEEHMRSTYNNREIIFAWHISNIREVIFAIPEKVLA